MKLLVCSKYRRINEFVFTHEWGACGAKHLMATLISASTIAENVGRPKFVRALKVQMLRATEHEI